MPVFGIAAGSGSFRWNLANQITISQVSARVLSAGAGNYRLVGVSSVTDRAVQCAPRPYAVVGKPVNFTIVRASAKRVLAVAAGSYRWSVANQVSISQGSARVLSAAAGSYRLAGASSARAIVVAAVKAPYAAIGKPVNFTIVRAKRHGNS